MATSELRDLVERHWRRVQAVASNDPFVDVGRAKLVAQSCFRLLDQMSTLPPGSRDWVKAACLYYAAADDADDDFTSVAGFDDDAQVVNHVAVRVGLSRLCVPGR